MAHAPPLPLPLDGGLEEDGGLLVGGFGDGGIVVPPPDVPSGCHKLASVGAQPVAA
jgi:hypothetical protein